MDLEERAQLGVGRFLDGAHVGATSVVYEDVDAAVAAHRVIDDRCDPGLVGDVKLDRIDLIWVAGDQFL
jgi:hypothetical protein